MKKLKELIQAVLAIPVVKKLTRWSALVVTGMFSSNRVFSILYHLLCFFPHSREQQAVLKGQYRYFRNEYRAQSSKVNLRRNIHRLEKGLLMRPRRAVFGLNFIGDTVQYFEIQVFSDTPMDREELYWASDVLEAYFEATDKRPFLDKLRNEFERIRAVLPDRNTNERKRIPYRPDQSRSPAVAYDDLLAQSPSACNRQPFHYRIYDDKALVQKVASLPFGSAGYAHNIPAIVVVTGDLSNYFSARDRYIIYIDASLSAMGFIYALETMGLSSCVINWPDFEPLEMKITRKLGLRLEERPIMMIAVGYPDAEGEVAYSQRKPIEHLRSYNQIG